MDAQIDTVNIKGINYISFKQKMLEYKNHPVSFILFLLTIFCAALTIGILIYLILYILIQGIPNLTPELFSLEYTSENASLVPALVNTIIMTLISLIIAVPLGIFTAIYLVEYAKRGNKLVKLVRVTAETLSGIPSIVYGLFGMLFFVDTFGWGKSLIAGSFTMSIMILPLIIRTTEEALKTVPDSFREGSFGLGAGKLRTVFRVILPVAVPSILSGIILAIGRVVGESAALIYTAGTIAKYPTDILSSTRTLSVHMYICTTEGLHTNQAYGTAVVLLVLVVIINALSSLVAKKLTKKMG